MVIKFDAVYYEPHSLSYVLGEKLKEVYSDLPWNPIESHNSIREMQEKPNAEFAKMKRNLIIGTRKTHKYVENHKVSDYLVPFTSSGCTAMCLYCYLLCNYNKCAYLRLFVNREEMLDRLLRWEQKKPRALTFEIGSNSDLILENTITDNLIYTVPRYVEEGSGKLTFPSKFHMVEPLLKLEHKGKIIFRMSVNPQPVIAPVILEDGWQELYTELLEELEACLTEKMKKQMFLEIILMTYSYVHRAINQEAFPGTPELYDKELMTGRGRGRYCYRDEARAAAEVYLRAEIKRILGDVQILYIS